MGNSFFVASSLTFFLLLNTLIFYFPQPVNQATGLDTTSLSNSTDIGNDVNTNVTQTNSLSRASDLAAIYSKPETSNRILGLVLILYSGYLLYLIVDVVWIG